MEYFDDPENVEEYIRMAEGHDGRELIAVLRKYLTPGATVLELGMGPGTDLNLLDEHFRVTGSDKSDVFVERYRREHPDADVMQLDAVTLDTGRQFDGIYSNKVLQHLTRPQLKQSMQRQAEVLTSAGILVHSFWYGNTVEEFSGMRFVYHTEDSILDAIGDHYEILEMRRYTEMEGDDSLYVVLRKKH